MSNADVIYYNLTIGNNDPNTRGLLLYNDIPTQITALNNIPIINNPDEYYASIIRFQIPSLTLPLANITIQTPVLDINKTIFSFAITDNAGTPNGTQTFVSWKPQVILPTPQIPPVNTPLQTPSPYYLAYSYNWFIDLWNVALSTACSLYPSAITKVPFFAYDSATQLISLYADPTLFTGSNALKIWINNSFLTYFVGYEKVNVNQGVVNNPNGLDNYLVIRDNLVNEVKLGATPTTYVKNDFEFSAFGYWNFLKNIIITTTMNVNSEVVFNNNQSAIQSVEYINILEDYYPDLSLQSGAGITTQLFTYNAQSLFRIFSFNQKTPLYKIDLGVNVVDTYGNIFPLLLPKGELANFKIMFIKKEIYSGINKLL